MIYQFQDYELDDRLYQLRQSGDLVSLEPQVFRLLAYLLTHRDRVVSREELFEKLWPGQVVGDAAITYCVAKARKAVGDTGTRQRILKTVHGHGYRLVAQVSVQQESLDVSVPAIRLVADLPQQRILPAPEVVPLLTTEPRERDFALWLSLSVSPRGRQLILVGCLFVCGWITSLWRVSGQSPWKLAPGQPAAYQAGPAISQTEGQLCPWLGLATQQPMAQEAFRQGWESANRSTPATDVEARWRFQRAIDIDPTYAAAYASLGLLAWQDWLSWGQDANRLEQASVYLQKSVALDSSCPRVLTLLSQVLLTQRRQAQAVSEAERRHAPLPLTREHVASLPSVAHPWMTIATGE